MQRTLGIVCALTAWVVSAVSQQSTVATLDPVEPQGGKTVVITYNSGSPRAAIKNVEQMIAEIMILGETDPIVLEPAMKKSGMIWKGSFVVPQNGAQLILYRFRSGDVLDDNSENTWKAIVTGSDGRPVRGAYLARATALQYPNLRGFKSQKDTEAASADIDAELQLYPDNYRAQLLRWQMMGRAVASPEGAATIRAELDPLYIKHAADQEAVAQLLSWYDRIGERQKADSIRTIFIAADPKGKVAEAAQENLIYQERDPATRVRLIEEFLGAFPQKGSALDNMHMQLFAFATRANDYAKAEAVLASMDHPSGQMYNSLAWPLIEKGENLEQAVVWAKKGVDLLDPTDLSQKPRSSTTADWKRNTTFGRGMVLDTYGFGLMKLGKDSEAERAFDEALRLTEYQDPEINQHAVECLIQGKKYQKAAEVSLASITKGKANTALMDLYAKAYGAVHGSDKGLQQSIESAQQAAQKALADKVASERVNTPAPVFSLKSLDGSTVSLSDLRGKIVVVDFSQKGRQILR